MPTSGQPLEFMDQQKDTGPPPVSAERAEEGGGLLFHRYPELICAGKCEEKSQPSKPSRPQSEHKSLWETKTAMLG